MLRSVLSAFLLVTSGTIADAQPRKPAELFPPATLAYAEIDDPAALADAVAAMVKGSALEDGLKLIHDRRDANKDPRLFNGQPALSFLATVTSPEFFAEFRKFRGAAVGWTGFTKSYEPKFVGVVLFGDSTAAGLIAKTFLANEATFRRVDTLDGVPIFQSRASPSVTYDPNSGKPIVPEPAKATEGPQELTYAYLPGLFVIGSNKEAVADVLARHREKPLESFATSEGYKSLTDLRKPGVTFCVRLRELVTVADKAKKSNKDVLDPTLLAYLKLVLSGTAAPTLAGQFTVGAEGLALTITITRDATRPSPLLDMLDGGLAPTVLDVCPSDLAAVCTLALPKVQRASACLRLADAVAQADGEVGKLPSDWLAEFEQKTKRPIRDQLLSSVRAISLLLPPKQELPPKVEVIPLIALHFESEANAEDAAAAIPALIAALRDAVPSRPSTETVSGVKVSSVADVGGPLHFARSQTTIILGRDRNRVAVCSAGTGKNLATEFAGRKVLVPDASTAAYAAILPLGMALSDQWGNGKLLNRFVPRSSGPELLIDNLPPNVLNQQPLYTDQELAAAFGPLPPLTGRVTKLEGKVALEVRLDFRSTSVQKVIDAMIPVVEKWGTAASPANGRFYLDR
ncbi:hypothetical protein [Limnoglobus roseus]|uniref:hypothetical protein n=1 Tax=Limnoglobus roseus TaxID=2598579 RepID=UPI0011EA97FA|nr:hypothetical protein [Limnoglobus roseus]